MKPSRRQSSARASSKRLQASYKLTVHGPEYGTGEELVINPEAFPDAKVHDLWEISQPEREHPRLVMQIRSLAPIRGKFQISILKDIAAQFQLDTYHEVVVQKIEPTDATVDFIELSFKDQFMSRADIWRYKVAMIGRCMYAGKIYETLGTRAQAEMLLANEKSVLCGVMAKHTKLILRSKSSRIFWLVHMSREMWDFDDDGEMYFEKLVNRLVRGLVAKWQETSVSHSVTILMFSRSYYDKEQFPADFDPAATAFANECQSQGFGPGCAAAHVASGHGPSINVDCDGRYYEDFYKVIVQDYTGPDWSHLFKALKREFATYAQQHRWRLPQDSQRAKYEVRRFEDPVTNVTSFGVQWTVLPHGVPARAIDGNMLEAINVTLNIFDKHYMDRDLYRAGQGIVMITAGCSVYKVRQRLAQITKQRMMDTGVGMDMISLTKPPMHPVPLFIWQKQPKTKEAAVTNSPLFCVAEDMSIPLAPLSPSMASPTFPPQAEKSTYNVPHWINVSFLDFDCTCGAAKKSLVRCACLDAQNEAFHALPASRMFDVVAPDACMVFPVALVQQLAPARPSPRAEGRGALFAQLLRLHSPATWTIEKAPAHLHDWWLQPQTRDLLSDYDDAVFDLSEPPPKAVAKRPSVANLDPVTASPGLPPMLAPSLARRITSMHNLQRHAATPNRGGSAATSLSRSFPKTPDFGPASPTDSDSQPLRTVDSSFDLGTSVDSSLSLMKHRSMTDFLVSPRSRISSTDTAHHSPVLKPHRQPPPVNPFQLNECSTRLTSNRRRWSHIFPWSQTDHWVSGPNWKSLVNPAVLPLTTDYYPAPNELHTCYTESFYTLMLLENSSSLSTHQLLVEMVCQRLSCDYQLVSVDDGDGDQALPTVYHLSMGHRIHVLSYDEQQQTVDVKCYFKRPKTHAASNDPVVYRYALYDGLTKSFHKEQQTFYELPHPQDNWNTTDNLLSGYVDTMPDSTKCRRIRFVIVPPPAPLDEAAYFARFQKLVDFFQSKVGKDDVVRVAMQATGARRRSIDEELGQPKKAVGRDYYRVHCSTTARMDVDCRSEWLMLLLDQVHDVGTTFHVDVRWLACSGSVVEDFISGLRRKCKQAGLELRRIPEYTQVHYLQVHPFLSPILLPFPLSSLRGCAAKAIGEIHAHLVTLGFVRDGAHVAGSAGIGYGLGIEQRKPRAPTLRKSSSYVSKLDQWKERGYEQYMHRNAPVFLRVLHDAFVWVPSYAYDTTFELSAEALFATLCQWMHKALERKVRSDSA
ncbi:hypothetical protein ACHHYP_15711 [Achlya hypogyna]|uniref:DEP domain-containing protein n=1 Tax=Achlya hypogyna TaxID=1202772 RepID=A0A1V9YA92_ACHHY|nr:hypothetical protein ACHHYP_15711 [Achlya hypogyna]